MHRDQTEPGRAMPLAKAGLDRVSGGALVGQAIRRREDLPLVQGQGRFVADIPLQDALHIAFLRSPAAGGAILGCETAAAAAMPGVAAVLTAADLTPLGRLTVNPVLPLGAAPDFPVLAAGRVLAVGQPVAAVLADSADRAADAVAAIDLSLKDASRLPAPGEAVFALDWQAGDAGAACDAAAHVVAVEVRHSRLAPCPLEGRAIAVDYHAATGDVTVWLSSQTPHRARSELAGILGVDAGRIRVVAPDVGGAFGMKASLYPEEVLAVWAAFALCRPVRWTATRGEDLLAASHGRGMTTRGRLAVAADGRFLALQARIDAPLGHWLTTSAAVPLWNAGRILPGPYLVPALDVAVRGHADGTAAVGIYRGAGRPEAAMLMERLVDRAAQALGMDPLDLRRANLIPPAAMPWQGPTGIVLDSGDYPRLLELAAARADLDALRAQQRRRRAGGELIGLGCAMFVEPCGQGWESARVRRNADGSVDCFLGGSSQGHGRETACAQILADLFGISADAVTVRHGDTADCPEGIGALASRSTAIGGSAVLAAGREVLARLPAAGPSATVEAAQVYTAEGEAWGSGCYIAQVAVDPATGRVQVERMVLADDAGIVVNPMLVAGQLAGGMAQGLGEALLERLVYDTDGQLLTGSLMDYALPRAADMPVLEIGSLAGRSPANLLGAKGVGEAGTIGAPAAIANAVLDALRPLGVQDLPLPIGAEAVWRAIQAAQAAEPEELR
ncbi:MAG: xanthine dehydrogenase family protein molybdopterin-binding subunit [Sneathiellaceae bacterium]